MSPTMTLEETWYILGVSATSVLLLFAGFLVYHSNDIWMPYLTRAVNWLGDKSQWAWLPAKTQTYDDSEIEGQWTVYAEPVRDVAPQPRTVPVSLPVVEVPAHPYVPVNVWMRELFEVAAHILLVGGSGSGKTSTARGLLLYIIRDRHEKVVILDPKANKDTWLSLPVITNDGEINRMMGSILGEFNRRLALNPTLTEREADETFQRVWVFIDETSFINDSCPNWLLFFRRVSSMARALKIHLVILNQSDQVKELGIEGRSGLRDNFTTLRLVAKMRSKENPAPIKIEYKDRTVEGFWCPKTFMSAAEYAPITESHAPTLPEPEGFDFSTLSPVQRRVLQALIKWDEEVAPSKNQLQRKLGIGFQKVSEVLSSLLDLGLIDKNNLPTSPSAMLEELSSAEK